MFLTDVVRCIHGFMTKEKDLQHTILVACRNRNLTIDKDIHARPRKIAGPGVGPGRRDARGGRRQMTNGRFYFSPGSIIPG